MKQERELLDLVYQREFGAFVEKAYEAVYPGQRISPNWHIEAICYWIQQMVEGVRDGRLVLNLPPRTLKSFIVSVALPAWQLGHDPTARIIVATYGEDLSSKFSRDFRALMESRFYKRVFRTRLNPRKITETEIETARRGSRLATSVGGALTGRGCTTLIIDDPLKANDAESEVARTNVNDWFRNTALSRLDVPAKSLIIITQQRLHAEDLSGVLIEKGWPALVIPAIATECATYARADGETHLRQPGELLQPGFNGKEVVEQKKLDLGSRLFAAQYQQDPTPPDGNRIKKAWLTRYEEPQWESYERVILTCDPAGKAGPRNDYTAITVVGIQPKAVHVLHAARGHWTSGQMRDRIMDLAEEWRVDLVIIEDTAGGMSLIQDLKEESSLNVIGRTLKEDKVTRLSRHEGRFEAGRIALPREAPWLADFEHELLAFPYGRHDDQLDALLLALDYYAERLRSLQPLDITIDIDSFWRPSPWRIGESPDEAF